VRRLLILGALLALLASVGHAQRADRVAPPRYAHLVLRVGGAPGRLFSNLRYESNNRSMRGDFDPRPASGCENARRQRSIASRIRGLFVLRDALFSQQDHPIEHRACAIMMPANWVTAAVADTMGGRSLQGLAAPALEDDAAWAALASPLAMFGSFQASDRLYEVATRARASAGPLDRARIENARYNVRALAAEARHLIDAAPGGAAAVARAGAERIARSDREYFTAGIRRDHVIVLAVEHPSDHERRDENKGLSI